MGKNTIIPAEPQMMSLVGTDERQFLAKALTTFLNELMLAEAENLTGAEYYSHSDERQNYFNGKRTRNFKTGVGNLALEIPKLRKGTYFPDFLEPRKMADVTLQNLILEAYILGVSTRKMEKLVMDSGVKIDKNEVSRITKQLEEKVTAFRNRPIDDEYPIVILDATFPRIAESGSVSTQALMIAIGVSKTGHRKILGFDISQSEAESNWKTFLNTLISRGLTGVKLVISDAHAGLKGAIFSTFNGIQWQICAVHCERNILSQVKEKDKNRVAAKLKSLFLCENIEQAKAELNKIVDEFKNLCPKAMEILKDSENEILTFYNFFVRIPSKERQVARKHIYTSNLIERVNREVKRRAEFVQVFPNQAAALRLCGAVLYDISFDWECSPKPFFSMSNFI